MLTSELLCWGIILLSFAVSQKPDSRLVLCSGNDTVDGDRFCSDIGPLSPLLAAGSPPVENNPESLYDGAVMIAPEGGNPRGIWRPPRCGHWRSGCCPRHNRLGTEAYPRLFLQYGKKYQEWKEIMKVQPSSRGDSPPPPPIPGLPLRPRGYKIRQCCTNRSSGCGFPVDYYILRFLHHSSSQMSATAPFRLLLYFLTP